MSRVLSLPHPHTRYCYEELHAPGQIWRAMTWQVLFFLLGWQDFHCPGLMTWIFLFLELFVE
jgi:hypothetical protein